MTAAGAELSRRVLGNRGDNCDYDNQDIMWMAADGAKPTIPSPSLILGLSSKGEAHVEIITFT
jgi:hypothetical protein